jgi:hypothetical protein
MSLNQSERKHIIIDASQWAFARSAGLHPGIELLSGAICPVGLL